VTGGENHVSEKVSEWAATGRRKTAVVRVRLTAGSGKISVNRRSFEGYFPVNALRQRILQPLRALDRVEKYDICAQAAGGGVPGQADAMRHAIARALIQAEEGSRAVLKDAGFLTRDPRMRERKKPGQPGARKRFQFSKR